MTPSKTGVAADFEEPAVEDPTFWPKILRWGRGTATWTYLAERFKRCARQTSTRWGVVAHGSESEVETLRREDGSGTEC